jgi:hypothetical protein
MKDYSVRSYLNIEIETSVQAEDEVEAVRIMDERLDTNGVAEIGNAASITVTEAGAFECWEEE